MIDNMNLSRFRVDINYTYFGICHIHAQPIIDYDPMMNGKGYPQHDLVGMCYIRRFIMIPPCAFFRKFL